jgi:hypothetical protein
MVEKPLAMKDLLVPSWISRRTRLSLFMLRTMATVCFIFLKGINDRDNDDENPREAFSGYPHPNQRVFCWACLGVGVRA